MKLNKYIIMAGVASIALTATTSCDDRDDAIDSIEYGRLFSALNLEARIVDQINARLSWSEVAGAKSYIINVYESASQDGEDEDVADKTQFVRVPEGASPIKTIDGIAINKVPYVVTGLMGQTRYVFEVIAVAADGSRSKGICTEAKTAAEQTFRTVLDTEIEANSVVLRWNADDAAGCTITVGEVTHTITAEEAAAKAATITGLKGETTYNAIMTGKIGKQRGKVEFTTAIDLGGAIAVNPGDNLNEIIASAAEGSTLALFPGTYSISSTDDDGNAVLGKIVVNKSVSIKAARPAERPVINGCIQIKDGASLTVSQVVLDGDGTDGSQTFDWKTADPTFESLIVEDCEVKNYGKGFFYLNVASLVKEIKVNNCIIHDIKCSGGDFFDSRKGGFNTLNITNSTFYNCAAERDFVRMDDASSAVSAEAKVNIDHCTLYNVGSGGVNYRMLYVRFPGNACTFTNNVVANFANKRGFTDQAKTNEIKFAGNYYFNCQNLQSIAEGNDQVPKWLDADGKTISANPFKAADSADFTLTDEDMNYKGAGDPRWVVK